MKNKVSICLVGVCLGLAVLGCSRLAQVGGKVNMFEGDNAVKAAAAIKDKVGGAVNVIRAEVRTDRMEVTIQSPTNRKDMDKYTYQNGTLKGPEPVQAMQIGSLEMNGEKYGTTPIDDIGWANIPAAVQRAIELSKLESAHVDSLTMENDYAEHTNPQAGDDRKKVVEDLKKESDRSSDECVKGNHDSCDKKSALDKQLFDLRFHDSGHPLVFTWRLFVEGPRGRKDFWADKNGKLNEKAF